MPNKKMKKREERERRETGKNMSKKEEGLQEWVEVGDSRSDIGRPRSG